MALGKRNSASIVVAGGLAGLVSWLVTEPMVTSIPAGHHYSFGSFYGWFGHLLFGALTAGALTLAFTKQSAGWAKSWLACGLAVVIGGALVCLVDAASDLLWIQITESSFWLRGDNFASSIFWDLAVALALSASVALATHPSPARLKRLAVASLAAGGVAFFLQYMIGPLVAVIELNSINFADLASGKNAPTQWMMFDPSRLMKFMGMGITVGVMLGYGDMMLRRAWVRVLQANDETRDCPLDDGLNRIGRAEGLEVSLFGDPAVGAIHATIHTEDGNYFLTDKGSPSGTLLNGQPVRESAIIDGDEVTIGRFTMQMRTKLAQRYYTAQRQLGNLPPQDPRQFRHAHHRLIDPFGNILSISQGKTKIGRDPASKINVAYDSKVLPEQAEIDADSASARIIDLAGGTFVNGAPLTGQLELSDGDQIKVGDTTFVYRS